MKIMVCYNSSKQASVALSKAKEWAMKLDAEIILVTSFITEDRFHEKDIKAAQESLVKAKRALENDNLSCSVHLSFRGLEPGEDLLLYAKERDVDAIFIGIRQRSKVGKLLLGSVAQHLILNAECPVITVR